MLFDATRDPDILCAQCRIRLTNANRWSSYLCIDCHEAEIDAEGVNRPALIEAMRRYNQWTATGIVKAVAAATLVLVFGGFIHLITSPNKTENHNGANDGLSNGF